MKQFYSFGKNGIVRLGLLASALILFSSSGANAQTGASLNFDGNDDHIDIAHNPSFNITASISIEVWINTSVSGSQLITTKSEDSWYLAVNGDNFSSGKASVFLNGVSPGGWLNSTTTVSDGNWHHIAATYDGASLKLYIDGVLDAQSAKSGAIATGTNTLKIGMRPFYPTLYYFNGNIDELRIWNTARTECEINTYMKCEIPNTATGLVGNFHFNQGIAGSANNSATTSINSAAATNGTLQNFALSGSTSNWVSPGGVISGSSTPMPAPTITITGSSSTLCAGQQVTLSASGANSYTWSNGSTGNSFIGTPTANTTYSANSICGSQASIQIGVSVCSGVAENHLSSAHLFPNPTRENITVQLPKSGNLVIEVFSSDGKKLKSVSAEGTEQTIDLHELSSGIYLLRLRSGDEMISRIIVKQ